MIFYIFYMFAKVYFHKDKWVVIHNDFQMLPYGE